MALHQLRKEQIIQLDLDGAWEFFSHPANLNEITPPELQFRIVSPDLGEMFEGQKIEYRIRLAPLVWTRWVSEIREVRERESFVDLQEVGPYKYWHHRHSFEPVEEGVRISDVVDYEIGWGFLGELAHALFVKKKLERIFDYRQEVMAKKFGEVTPREVSGLAESA